MKWVFIVLNTQILEKGNIIKIKRETDQKLTFVDSVFKKFETIEIWNYI